SCQWCHEPFHIVVRSSSERHAQTASIWRDEALHRKITQFRVTTRNSPAGDLLGYSVACEHEANRAPRPLCQVGREAPHHRRGGVRSEEHTSELQSRFDLVCRLL